MQNASSLPFRLCVCLLCLLPTGCTPDSDRNSANQGLKNGSSKEEGDRNKKKSEDELPSIDEKLDVEALESIKLSREELDQGWILLFDGQSMMGWDIESATANWEIKEGALSATEGKTGLLCTTSRFSDYELRLEFKADSTVNSGIFLRTPQTPADPAKDCFELNIAPTDNPFPTGSLVGRAKVEPSDIGEIDPEDWHSFHALVDGDHVQIWFNGKPVVDYRDPTQLQSGLIGLQFREGGVQFRNIRIKPLLLNSNLPAKDLSQWNQDRKGDAKFELNQEGALQVEGGKGQLELLQPLQDFCLQAEVMTLSPKTNSGIFFRCIPGEEMNGYECQINSAFREDRRRPTDGGTGAIFRRQNARVVLGKDDEWTHITIHASGPHIATWVEGIQVVDFIDRREPHDNPRSGLRLDGGTVILQAHDAECKAKFRVLKSMPLPPVSQTRSP